MMKPSQPVARQVDFDAGLAWTAGEPDARALRHAASVAEAARAVLRVTAAAWGLDPAAWRQAVACWAN